MPFMCRQRRNRPMKRKALSAQATQKKEWGRKEEGDEPYPRHWLHS